MAKIKAMPIMPMEPAKEVKMVRAFLVHRLLKLKDSAVRKDMDAFPIFLWMGRVWMDLGSS